MSMDVKVSWQRKLTFTGTADSGFSVHLGTEKELGGDDDGFRPMELILIGLAGCTAMDVISILRKKRQDITDFEVQVHGERDDEHPRVFTKAQIVYQVTGNGVGEEAVRRAIELSSTRYCPAQAMFSKIMLIDLKYHIYEHAGNEDRRLIKSGSYFQTSTKQ
jgi:putative redox protein